MNASSGAESGETTLLQLTSEIVTAYVSNNPVPATQLPELIRSVVAALANLDGALAPQNAEPLKPAVSIRKSVTPDHIVCLEDGRKLKMLKRHLRTTFNMSPQQYREKWGLPADYPMVAPNYAARRSEFAKQIGLGRTAAAATEQPKRQRSNSRAAGSS
ncbi:MAG: MucR family transcriptional regulator [Rhodospirillales bacterium]|nr:MucR family transcriptional regulator [Rhodospirillales bacterium]